MELGSFDDETYRETKVNRLDRTLYPRRWTDGNNAIAMCIDRDRTYISRFDNVYIYRYKYKKTTILRTDFSY